MRYQGGKRRSAKMIVGVLSHIAERLGITDIGDMFAGSCAIEQPMLEVGHPITRINEGSPAVHATLSAVRCGWQPPRTLTRREYATIRGRLNYAEDLKPDPLTAFALAFCSYGGKWGAGLIAEDTRWTGERSAGASRSAAAKAHRDLLALRPALLRAELTCLDWLEAAQRMPDGGLVWLDPPWVGTEPYPQAIAARGPFDHERFRVDAAALAQRLVVVVSEAIMPDDWMVIAERRVPEPGLARDKVERLWMHRTGLGADLYRRGAA